MEIKCFFFNNSRYYALKFIQLNLIDEYWQKKQLNRTILTGGFAYTNYDDMAVHAKIFMTLQFVRYSTFGFDNNME